MLKIVKQYVILYNEQNQKLLQKVKIQVIFRQSVLTNEKGTPPNKAGLNIRRRITDNRYKKENKMLSAIVIGSGPAGISASLYLRRAGIDTTVISTRSGALKKTEKIENYYGFPEPVSGAELEERGILGARRLGVRLVEGEAVSLSYSKKFTVKTNSDVFEADGVVIAAGASRPAPPIEGITAFEGRGVSYCAVCDGFFFRKKRVGVLGNGEYALNEVNELINLAESVTVFTNGENPNVKFPEGVRVVTDKILRFSGDTVIRSAELESGEKKDIDGLFIAYGVAGSTALAKKIGAITDGAKIKVNENMETNIKGLYAAGDCTGGLLQVSKAVYEGAKAGSELAKYLKRKM